MLNKLKSLAVAWLLGSIAFFNFFFLSYFFGDYNIEEAAKFALTFILLALGLFYGERIDHFFGPFYSDRKQKAAGVLELVMASVVFFVWGSFVKASLVRSFSCFVIFLFCVSGLYLLRDDHR